MPGKRRRKANGFSASLASPGRRPSFRARTGSRFRPTPTRCRAPMIAPLLSLALSVALFARVVPTDAAKDVVRQAVLAVEGDSATPVRTRWSARLQQDSTDRA